MGILVYIYTNLWVTPIMKIWVYITLCLLIPFYLSIYGSTALVDLGRFFSFLNLYTVGETLWTGDQPVARPLPTHRTTQTQNKRTQTSMPRVGFEPTIPVFERAKAVHALDRAVTVIDLFRFSIQYLLLTQEESRLWVYNTLFLLIPFSAFNVYC
jgi:hypothetical protein